MGSVEQPSAVMGERYLVRETKTRQELDNVLDIIWAANYSPYEPFVQLFFPILGYTMAHREAAITESKERFWDHHQGDPSSHWYYVLDTVTGKPVGCAQWVISESNPFAAGTPKLTAPWWPEGECRSFCEWILNQVYRPRASWMTRPHCGKWSSFKLAYSRTIPCLAEQSPCNLKKTDLIKALNWMAVDPSHRLRGIGSLLMNVGIVRADELNLECWMEASAMGKPLYEKFKFQALLKIAFDNEKADSSDEWRKCAHEMTPPPIFAMWRPKRGQWLRDWGEVKLPWELGAEK